MSDAKLYDTYAGQLQRTLNNDLADVAQEMSTGRGYMRGSKVEPAYMSHDTFERHRIETESRLRQNKQAEVDPNIVYPDDPNKPEVLVVHPDE